MSIIVVTYLVNSLKWLKMAEIERVFCLKLKRENKTWLFSHLEGIWSPSVAVGSCRCWLGPDKSVDFDAWHGLPQLIMMVALLAVWSSLSITSKVSFGSMLLELSGWALSVLCTGSGVHCSGNMPSSSTWALVMVPGLCGGSNVDKFLLMGIRGGLSWVICGWFPLSRKTKQTIKS